MAIRIITNYRDLKKFTVDLIEGLSGDFFPHNLCMELHVDKDVMQRIIRGVAVDHPDPIYAQRAKEYLNSRYIELIIDQVKYKIKVK